MRPKPDRFWEESIAAKLGALSGGLLGAAAVVAGLTVCAAPAGAAHHGKGWHGGFERLTYRVEWGYLGVGRAIIQARSRQSERVELLAETCADGTVDALYEERDRLLAHSRREGVAWRTVAFRTALGQDSGKRARQYRFPGNGVVYIRDLISGNNDYLPVPRGTVDVLTALYIIRGRPLEAGRRFQLPVLDRGEIYMLHVAVRGRGQRHTALGEATPTIRLRTYLEEVATGRRERELRLWLTDDKRRLPVRVEAPASVASIRLRLMQVSHTPPPDPRAGLVCD